MPSAVTAAPSPAFTLHIPAAKALTPQEETELYREAHRKAPASLPVRKTLIRQLLFLDRFDEALEFLHTWKSEDFLFLMFEVEALTSRETEADNLLCEQVARRAVSAADSDRRRSVALGALGKIQLRLKRAEARETLDQALAFDFEDKDAWKRATSLALSQKRTEEVLERVDEMVANGAAHSRVIASQSLAFAQQGMLEQARHSQGLAQYFEQFDPAPPDGWATLAEFTTELAREISAHPGIRGGRYGLASVRSLRIDDPGLKRLRIFPQLQQMIRREIMAYVELLPESDHPFLKGRIQHAELRNWCVVTEGEGHETWHVHQNGWISGTFYIQVPDHIADGTEKGGCIAFGLPEDIIGQENADRFGEVLCRPHAGLMMIFPSHLFHRTYPHGGAGRRICYAFDIIERQDPAQP